MRHECFYFDEVLNRCIDTTIYIYVLAYEIHSRIQFLKDSLYYDIRDEYLVNSTYHGVIRSI